MIQSEIAALAEALSNEFDIPFDEAIKRAWRVAEALEKDGYTLTEGAN